MSHSKSPESIYDNPGLYPSAFPWLFPYGLGGLPPKRKKGDKHVAEFTRRKQLLLYHDKRFQLDHWYPLVSFNHFQIKSTVKTGFLVADRANFPNTVKRLQSLDRSVLQSITERYANGERVVPSTPAEKLCFDVLKDLGHISSHIPGSMGTKS
ncbi:hypothetical protein SISNIDRAFT_421058, partial [Sistotremastrum niveocremeum HHB9708]